MTKYLVLIVMGLSLVACSSTNEQNTFMAYEDLQDKVRSHDAQWQDIQEKLTKIDELEAEVAALKKEKTMLIEEDDIQVSPVSIDVVTPVEEDVSNTQEQDSALLEVRAMAENGNVSKREVMADRTIMTNTEDDATQNESLIQNVETVEAPEDPELLKVESEYAVQVAAYRNKDEVLRGWDMLLKKDPETFQTLHPLIDQKEVRGNIMYLLKAGPFINQSYSNDFCTSLKSKGIDCLVTEYKGESFDLN
ncbi:SPOR domain-containing protein [Marinomonas sp.]|nr:SPOR domain-containing protein [Marinomonas sp.]MDB4837350.1 SPOR domain-containing protein [Marinomonas sp.]